MKVWQTPVKHHLFWGSESSDWRTITMICRRSLPESHFDVYLLRWERDSRPLSPTIDPSGWIELWPREPVTAHSLDRARDLARELTQRFEANPDTSMFEKRLHKSHHLEQVRVIEREDGAARAVILRHPDKHYEIHYFAMQGDSPFTWHWEETPEDITCSDSLRAAERIARRELKAVAAFSVPALAAR